MTPTKIVALVLIAAGVLALVYGGFTYTKDRHELGVGPLSFEVAEKERVNVPMWAGVASIVVGVVLLVTGGARRRRH